MASRFLPNLKLKGFWLLGEDNWKTENDLNLLKLSVLTQGGVIDKVSVLPAASDGDVYVLDETAGGSANQVAIRDAGAWVNVTPEAGWLLYNRADEEFLYFDGDAWGPLGVSLPPFDPVEDVNKVLTIKPDGSGYDWAESTGGGGGSSDIVYPIAAGWRVIADAAGSNGVDVGFGEIQWMDPDGYQVFESGVVGASSSMAGFDETKPIDGNQDPGNGWKADIPTTEDAIGAWWSQTWIADHEVKGVMLYPINGAFDTAPEEFRAQRYDDDTSAWVDVKAFTWSWTDDAPRFFEFDGEEAPGADDEAIWAFVKDAILAGENVTLDIDEDEKTITVNATGGEELTMEQIRDAIAGMLVEGDNIDIVYNDDGDNAGTITISAIPPPHTVGFGFGECPDANEVVFAYVFVEDVQWADECVGSYAYQGVVTTATYNLTIKKNGADIGTIQFQSGPSIAFGITGSSPVDWAPGDVLTIVGAPTPDATLANVAVTFYGVRTS